MKHDPPVISLLEFRRVSELLYRRAGLRYGENKLYYLTGKLQKRMMSLGITRTAEYLRLLENPPTANRELQELVDLVTINETYFFRDFPQLESFSEGCLTEIVRHKNATGSRAIDVWSAGCSSGEEAYTIAIILSEMLTRPSGWTIRILGSDIDGHILEKAKAGVYETRSLREVPDEYLSRYFTRQTENSYLVNEDLRKMVRFEQLNFMDGPAMRDRINFDFIFCRNVLIYFDDISRRKVVDHFYVALNRPGFIFLGSSEAMGRITSDFTVRRLSNLLVYGKE